MTAQKSRPAFRHFIDFDASLDSGRLTDVEFKVRTDVFPDVRERKFRAHKLLLALRSEVFDAMFFGHLAEQGVVDVPDVHPDGFDVMLRYLYSGCARINCVLDALHARAAARKYLVEPLVEGCSNYIHEHLSPANLCSYLDYYAVTGEPNMDEFVPEIMRSWPLLAPIPVLSFKDLEHAQEYTVHYILENVRYVPEMVMAELALRWAQEQCVRSRGTGSPLQLKAVIRPFFPKLRFLTMTTEDFIRGPVTWGIMDDDEALCVLRNIVSKGALPLPPGFCESTQHRY